MRTSGTIAAPTLRDFVDRPRKDRHDADAVGADASGNRGSHLRSSVARLDGFLPETGGAHTDTRALPRRGQCASGAGGADVDAFRSYSGQLPVERLRFSDPVPSNGYLWWYLDGVSADGQYAVTVIAFIGSVFSPYYAWSGRKDPLNHVAVNVALYGPNGRWAMTERGRKQARRLPDGYFVDRSGISLEGDDIVIRVDERCAPIPRRLKGTIRLSPNALSAIDYGIDAGGAHRWRPLAPASPISVEMDDPGLSWRGTGYMDMNWGDRALEETFSHWDWMRVDLGGGESAIFYDTTEWGGAGPDLALLNRADGSVEQFEAPPSRQLPRTLWQVSRNGWSDTDEPATVRRTLEDTPFYARSELSTVLFGRERTAIHESLSLRRFKSPIVKMMLPFRMPRIT